MAERLMAKLERLGAEAGIKQMTPEIYRFSQLLNDDRLKEWEKATYWYYDKDGKLYSSNEVKLRISSMDNSLHFGAVPQHVKDLHGLLPLSIKREWVDLTDEEISEIAINNPPMVHEFARAVLAKSKEKNNG